MCVYRVSWESLYQRNEVLNCDYVYWLSVFFFATVGNTVVTLVLVTFTGFQFSSLQQLAILWSH
jgi:hypothetical protein